MTRVGIIRCDAHSESCAGFKCFPALRNHSGAFAPYEGEVELVGFDTCGGCARGKADKVVAKAMRLKEKGAEVIHLGNCLTGACPWTNLFVESISEQAGIPVVLTTHA
jgi:predicted metal-binding protein